MTDVGTAQRSAAGEHGDAPAMVKRTATAEDGTDEWRIHDAATRLRLWGTETVYWLPVLAEHEKRSIGSLESCWLVLQDDKQRVSRHHADLTFHASRGWTITDAGSKNGLHLDGAREDKIDLKPGMVIGIGDMLLVVESPLFCQLRELMCRFLGWGAERLSVVDDALFDIRLAIKSHKPLWLFSDHSHVAMARLLHSHVVGGERPFVVYEKRKQPESAARTHENGMAALSAARGGSLMLLRHRLPEDYMSVRAALRRPTPTSRVFMMVGTLTPTPQADIVIEVPSLRARESELERIIDAYAADAAAELGLGSITADERAWVASQATTFGDIEDATRRLVAMRETSHRLTNAAKRLGISHGSLSPWVHRRQLPSEHDGRTEPATNDRPDETK